MGDRIAKIIIGLGFGDEGKGTMTHYLSTLNNTNLVVRFNGGSQAAHNVVTPDGKHHTFAQFGSGSFTPEVATLLSRFMYVDPIALFNESRVLKSSLGRDPFLNHFIDERASIITPLHVAANRVKEWIRSENKHGSCGKGFGETVDMYTRYPDSKITAGDIRDNNNIYRQLLYIQNIVQDEISKFGFNINHTWPDHLVRELTILYSLTDIVDIANLYQSINEDKLNIIPANVASDMIKTSNTVFEGAQGVLLDEWHGFHPFTTWSNTTQQNALMLLDEAGFDGSIETIGVTRTYSTRHGKGPFVAYTQDLNHLVKKDHNKSNVWQDDFKAGYFDSITFKYALKAATAVGKIDSLALTHLDAFDPKDNIQVVENYLITDEFNQNKVILEINPNFDQNLENQVILTNLLNQCFPVTKFHCKTITDYISEISNISVRYTSSGPSLEHKEMLSPSNKI